MLTISIPSPCKEDWNKMSPDGQGRFCQACAKGVIDFSVMTDEAVQQYFIRHHGEGICGRFKNTQLQRIIIDLPGKKFVHKLPLWKKFLIASLIIFGASIFPFETTIAGTTFQEYLQQQPVKKVKQKKKARIVTNLKNCRIPFAAPDTNALFGGSAFETYGFTVTREAASSIAASIFDSSWKNEIINTEDSSIHTNGTGPVNKNKKTPVPVTRRQGELILPPFLSFKKFSKKKNNAVK